MAKKMKKNERVSFEDSIAKLSDVVRDLEEGKLSLDDSLVCYEQGVGHLKMCQQILAEAERKIEILSGVDADGNPVTQRFDDEELSLTEKANQRSRRRSATPKKGAGRATKSSQPSEQADVDENGTLF